MSEANKSLMQEMAEALKRQLDHSDHRGESEGCKRCQAFNNATALLARYKAESSLWLAPDNAAEAQDAAESQQDAPRDGKSDSQWLYEVAHISPAWFDTARMKTIADRLESLEAEHARLSATNAANCESYLENLKAKDEQLAAKDAEIERLREAIRAWDALSTALTPAPEEKK